MSISEKTLVVLGGSGFIGRRVIQEAVRTGWQVMALGRSEASAALVTKAGATLMKGDADDPGQWISKVAGANAIIDLIQPPRPKRLGRAQMRKISGQRQTYTRQLTAALNTLKVDNRPILVSVSGIDDLAPDRDGYISAASQLSTRELGFSTIGIPVRKIIEQSGVDCSFVYLASVYGPGGPFGEVIFPAIAAGKWKNFGGPAEYMILVHVDDVARALVRIAGLDRTKAARTSFVLTDNEPVAMTAFAGLAAKSFGVAAPGSVPKWMATLFAGKPIVETTLHRAKARHDFEALPDCNLVYPSYREGVPDVVRVIGR